MIVRKYLFLIYFILVSISGSSQSEPTLKETLEWLKGKIEKERTLPISPGQYEKHHFDYDLEKNLIVVTAERNQNSGILEVVNKCKLSDLNPENVQIEKDGKGFYIGLNTTNSEDLIERIFVWDDGYHDKSMKDEIWLGNFKKDMEENIAERMKKAFINAIVKAGGKPEKF